MKSAVPCERDELLASSGTRRQLTTVLWFEPNGGEELAYALLAASCTAEVTTEHVYLTLDHSAGRAQTMTGAGDREVRSD